MSDVDTMDGGLSETPDVAPADPKAALVWLWELYDVLSASHRNLPPPPFERPHPDAPVDPPDAA